MKETEMRILMCENCGGYMNPNQGTGMYECKFCGSSVPLTDENYYKCPPIRYRHRKIEVDGDKFSVLHTAVTQVAITPKDEGWLSRDARKANLDAKLEKLGSGTGYVTVAKVEFPCTNCGSTIEGDETQNIFECSYCKTKIGREEVLKPGAYNIKHVMGRNGQKLLPRRAVPFSVTKEQAMQALQLLIKNDPKLSEVFGLERYIEESIHAFYLPFSLVDISVQADSKGFLEGGLYYQEYLNWACPESVLHDVFVTDRLDPWDFSGEMPFDPSFVDGDVRIAGMENICNRVDITDSLMYRRMERDIERSSGQRQELIRWGHDYHPHHALVLLPVYWVDVKEFFGSNISAAVNGQTGKPVVQVLGEKEKDDYFAEGKPSMWGIFSADSTMKNEAIKIKMVKGSMKWAMRV